MNNPFYTSDTHEKVIKRLHDTYARNEHGVEAESEQYAKGWNEAFATVELELNHLFTAEEKAKNATAEKAPAKVRKAVLDKAAEYVCGRREREYGTPEDNFSRIAALWSAYKGCDFTAHDVAMLMALLKVGRIAKGSGGMDSYIDLCGYAACAGEIVNNAVCADGITSSITCDSQSVRIGRDA